jgi:hypothetical protein
MLRPTGRDCRRPDLDRAKSSRSPSPTNTSAEIRRTVPSHCTKQVARASLPVTATVAKTPCALAAPRPAAVPNRGPCSRLCLTHTRDTGPKGIATSNPIMTPATRATGMNRPSVRQCFRVAASTPSTRPCDGPGTTTTYGSLQLCLPYEDWSLRVSIPGRGRFADNSFVSRESSTLPFDAEWKPMAKANELSDNSDPDQHVAHDRSLATRNHS